jgi:hypothetical protein
MKLLSQLRPAEFRVNPVWRFANSDERGELMVKPVKKLPIKTLVSCVVGTEVVLASGGRSFALIGNIDVSNPELTEQFLTLSFFRTEGEVFHLSRYHDFAADERGPKQLSTFLRLSLQDVFPISWDISRYSLGNPSALSGVVEAAPRRRLTRAEIIALAVPSCE